MLLAAILFATAIPIGNPPMIGGSLDGLLYDGSHFLLLQRGVRTTLADDGTPLTSTSDGDRVALASNGRTYLSVRIAGGNAYADNILLGTADAAAAAWDGTRYLVALRDGPHLSLTYLGGDRIDIADDVDAFALAARDEHALVVWASGSSLFARTPTGGTFALGNGVLSDVAAGREGFMVATLSGGIVVARHIDLDGRPDATYPLAHGTAGAHLGRERYAYALAWPDGNELLGERIDPIASTMHGPFVIAMLDQPIDHVAVATTTATTLVAYSAGGIFAKQIDDTLPGKAMAAHLARQSSVYAADSLVIWQQEPDEIRVDDAVVAHGALEDVAFGGGMATIVYRDASGLQTLRLPAASATSESHQQVASTLRVWNDHGTIVAQHLGSDERIVVGTGEGTPHVRWDGAAFVVTWPEVIDATTVGFASLRLGGTKSYVTKAAMPISLTDWSDNAHAVYYVRDGRLYMQAKDTARRRAAR